MRTNSMRMPALVLLPSVVLVPAGLAADPEDVSIYREHVTILASPMMEGRLPGTKGMELAKDYMELYLRQAGLEPMFAADGETTFRQPFELGGTTKLLEQSMNASIGRNELEFERGDDYEMTGFGVGGDVEAGAVFVGYSIGEGRDGYSSYAEDDDLSGKIAVMFRFEPMTATGDSMWSDDGSWSSQSGFNRKIRAAVERDPAAIIIINTPGANDDRVGQLTSAASRVTDRVPVFMMSVEAGSELLEAADWEGRTALELRRHADQGGSIVELEGTVRLSGKAERVPTLAENVGGLLRGKGDLADELIVVGAHLDHLGQGEFGSRSGPGKLHPGADDNASGSAAIIMLAENLVDYYADLPDDTDARSILFTGFSAEESGLNGSRHYAENPPWPIEDHALMINFDMIGRIENRRLSVSGMDTGEGLRDWLEPIAEASPLDVVMPTRMSGASDHTSFVRKEVPVLFGIIADFHGDYHTPADTTDKLNFEGGADTVELFTDILEQASVRPERFRFVEQQSRRNRGSTMSRIKVRVGIRPAPSAGEPGVLIREVTPGSAAEEAGLEAGDLIIRWNKDELENGQELLEKLVDHVPGEKVEVMVARDGQERVFVVRLRAK